MKNNAFVIVAAVLVSVLPMSAETRFNLKFDIANASVVGRGIHASTGWAGLEGELEIQPRHRYVPGFAFGVRKENAPIDEGDFLYARVFKKVWTYGGWDLYPSLGIIYGVPMTKFGKTEFNSDRTQYDAIFLVHNITTFVGAVDKDGVLYPEITCGIRKQSRGWNIDLVPGIRILKFGILRSGGYYAPSDFRIKTVVCPTIGIRLGYRI